MADGNGRSLRPKADVAFHPVSGGAVIFDPGSRRLFALNPAAGLAWLCLDGEASLDDVAQAMVETFAAERDSARTWARDAVETFREFGLFDDAAQVAEPTDEETDDRLDIDAAVSVRQDASACLYEMLGTVFEVTAPPSLAARVRSLLGQLAIDDDRQPSVRAVITAVSRETWHVDVDGRRSEACSRRRLVAELERLLVQRIVPATPHLLALHCAGLQRMDGCPFLFAGDSGAGKTTLSIALARAGWTFGSDELVLVGEDGALRPLPLPACVKAESFDQVGSWFPALAAVPPHDRYGRTVKFLGLRRGPLGASDPSVVFLRRVAGGAPTLRSLPSFEGLQRLLAQCLFVPATFEAGHVERLLRWHRSIAYFELIYVDCASVVDLLASPRHCDGHDHRDGR